MSDKPKKRKNSKQKGKRYELEACKVFQAAGYTAERTAQNCGRPGVFATSGEADIRVKELDRLHIEVKSGDDIRLGTKAWDAAFRQAQRDCGDKLPVVMHRVANGPWMLTFMDHAATVVLVTVVGDYRVVIACQHLNDNEERDDNV